jgi:prostaglandin-H2 D-isomerase / glutathione transferase
MASSSTLLSDVTVTYFDVAARAEAIRLVLTVAGVPFSDERVAFKDWGSLKPTLPLPFMPFLTLKGDGRKIFGHRTILRLIGRELNLYPTDVLEQATVDQVLDACDDLMGATNSAGQGLPQAEKEAARLEATTKPTGKPYHIMQFINDSISGKYVLGDTISVADYLVATMLSTVISGLYDGVPTTVLEQFPKVQALRKTLAEDPKITAYYDDASRKDTPMGKLFAAARSS